jgi:hypothetical protein
MSEPKRPHGSRFRDALVIVSQAPPIPVASHCRLSMPAVRYASMITQTLNTSAKTRQFD